MQASIKGLVRPPEVVPADPSYLGVTSAACHISVKEPTWLTQNPKENFHTESFQSRHHRDQHLEELVMAKSGALGYPPTITEEVGWCRPSLSLQVLEKAGYYVADVGKAPTRLVYGHDVDTVPSVNQSNDICNTRETLEQNFAASVKRQPHFTGDGYMEDNGSTPEQRMRVAQAEQQQDRSPWEALDLEEALDSIHGTNELPLVENCLPVLQKCRESKSLEYAIRAYSHICTFHLEDHVAIGNYVVPMFVDCGSVSTAQQVFNRLIFRNEYSWTSLVTGYTQCGELQHALTLYQQMIDEDVHPSNHTHVSLLKACAKLKDLENGQVLHSAVTLRGSDQDLFISSTLISMYAECGLFPDMEDVFNNLPFRDVVTWNSLITSYAEHGNFCEAVACLERMQSEYIPPNSNTLTCILKACSSMQGIESGRAIHEGIVTRMFQGDLSVGNAVIDMYAKCGLLKEAHEVLKTLPARDIVSWTALIAGYAEHGPSEEALKCLEKMHLEDISPNEFTFACILKACCMSEDLNEGQRLHVEITKKGFDRDLHTGNALIDMYASHGFLLDAHEVCDKLPARDIASWTPLISGYTELARGEEALYCLEQMQHEHISADAMMFACALKACSSVGAVDWGRDVHMKITCMGFDTNSYVSNSLISLYARFALIAEARAVFEMSPSSDVAAWSSMISGCGMNHNGICAIQCFEEMQQLDMKPDAVTITCLLTACSHAGMVHKGQKYFKQQREKHGLLPTREHYACVVDLLARSGYLYEAEAFLSAHCSPCEEIWASLLTACRTYGEVELGRRCFDELVRMSPEVAAWYAMMVDIYMKAGRLDDAHDLEVLRKHAGARKKPACASIEVNNNIHTFVVGEEQNSEISSMLKSLNSRMKGAGHVPDLDSVVNLGSNGEKELLLCEHAERLAIAFGLLHLPQGETIRITKNLRMCNDCHNSSKVLSKIERRDIILRDDACVHHFKDGFCSCGDLF